MDWSEIVFIALVIFAATQWANLIAKKTADEIERRSKPPVAPLPRAKQPRLSLRESLTLIVAVNGLLGLLALAGHFHLI